MNRLRLVGKSIPVESFIEPISTAISGKDAASPIPAMRGRREAYHEYPCRWIAECGDRSAPINPFPILPAFHAGNRFAMVYEARTFPTLSDRLIERDEGAHGRESIITPLDSASALPMQNVPVSMTVVLMTVSRYRS